MTEKWTREMLSKPADTARALNDLIRNRWSPRAFDPDATVSEEQMTDILEAARWAPSSSNSQPSRFLYGLRGDATYDAILKNLKPNNARWAFRAGALLLALARQEKSDGRPEPHGSYDVGQAVAYLCIQAQYQGLSVRQMAGFLPSMNEALCVPSRYRTIATLAIGKSGDASILLDEELQRRERIPRTRLPLRALANHGVWSSELDA